MLIGQMDVKGTKFAFLKTRILDITISIPQFREL